MQTTEELYKTKIEFPTLPDNPTKKDYELYEAKMEIIYIGGDIRELQYRIAHTDSEAERESHRKYIEEFKKEIEEQEEIIKQLEEQQ